jgi:hypothetical protein
MVIAVAPCKKMIRVHPEAATPAPRAFPAAAVRLSATAECVT